MGKRLWHELPSESVIFGASKRMLELRRQLTRVAVTNLPILLRGESGVGKSLLSRYIHSYLSMNRGWYLRYRCPIMPSTAMDSLLLAIPAAYRSHEGDCSEDASERVSTLFLDEIGLLGSEPQVRLLHGLSEVDGLGRGTRLRIVCSTTGDLRRTVRLGKFRKDLFYRLAVFTFDIPPLRSRLHDLSVIANYLLDYFSRRFGAPAQPFPGKLLERLHDYEWPGNIRELKRFVCRYVASGSTELPARLEEELFQP
jgi:DNA-binding NtrC family response regulator